MAFPLGGRGGRDANMVDAYFFDALHHNDFFCDSIRESQRFKKECIGCLRGITWPRLFYEESKLF